MHSSSLSDSMYERKSTLGEPIPSIGLAAEVDVPQQKAMQIQQSMARKRLHFILEFLRSFFIVQHVSLHIFIIPIFDNFVNCECLQTTQKGEAMPLPFLLSLHHQSSARVAIFSFIIATNSSSDIVTFSPLRSRTDTSPLSDSRSPTTSIYGIFCICASRIL